jgi:hypothetical protein
VGCPVEDEHGNVTYVPVGSTFSLFHCGADGEWHFGWATTDRRVGPRSGPAAGITAGVTAATPTLR